MGGRIGATAGPTRGWYVVAGALFLAAVVSLVWEITVILSMAASGKVFLAPGLRTIPIQSPGRYIIWLENKTFYDGRSYSSEPQLPDGATITVFAPGGEKLSVKSHTGISVQSGTSEKHSICTFEADRRAEYVIEVGGFTTPRVMMVRKHELGKFIVVISVCTLGEVAGFLLAPVIGVAVALLRWRARRRLKEQISSAC